MRNLFLFPSLRQSQLTALIYCIFGLLLCFCGANILLWACRILGIGLLAWGIWSLYLFFVKRNSTNATPLVQGVPCLLIGLVIAFSPSTLVTLFPVVIGIIIVINSISQMQRSFMLKDAHDSTWSVSLILAILLMIAGLVLILKPMMIVNSIMQAAGIVLIIEAIYMLYQSIQASRYLRP